MAEQSKVMNHPSIDGLTLFVAPPGPHEHRVHSHEAYSIIMLTSGEKNFHHSGKTVVVKAGEAAISNPGDLHGCGPIDGAAWSHRTFYVSKCLLIDIVEKSGVSVSKPVRLPTPVIKDQVMLTCLLEAHRASTEEDPLDHEALLLEVLSEFIAKYAETPTELETDEEQRSSLDIAPVG